MYHTMENMCQYMTLKAAVVYQYRYAQRFGTMFWGEGRYAGQKGTGVSLQSRYCRAKIVRCFDTGDHLCSFTDLAASIH